MPKLSACLITHNEEKNIERCLRALQFADEIIVMDGASHDKTVEIAQRFTNKVYTRPFDDFASQKNAMLEKASGEWVLSVDADETVTEELACEIRSVIEKHTEVRGYRIGRQSQLFGRAFRFSGTQHDKPIRLFCRDGAYFESRVHETVALRGRIGDLKNKLFHRSFQTVAQHLRRLELYTSLEGSGRGLSSGAVKPRGFLFRPLCRFCDIYILKKGFLDGHEGWLYAILSSYYEFVRWAKRWENGQKEERQS